MLCIKNGNVLLEDDIAQVNIIVSEGRIVALSHDVPDGAQVFDAKGYYVSPGFIDLHTHGRKNCDTMDALEDHLQTISEANLTTGCTSYLPTTMTMPISDVAQAIAAVARVMGHEAGARILGVHMEGPFISEAHKGAQDAKNIIPATLENFLALTGGHDIVKKITLAPENEGADALIRALSEEGISVSVGHSDATYEQAMKAFALGANSTTHTFNAMTPLKHRAPGIVGAVMNSPDVYAELILDGKHVYWPSAKILARLKGPDHLCLITDSLECAGMPVGQYMLGGQKVWVKNGRAELADGTIAGSITGLNEEVRNAVTHLNIPLLTAVKMASYNPARSLHIKDLGLIKEGFIADLILFDENIDVKAAFVKGQKKY